MKTDQTNLRSFIDHQKMTFLQYSTILLCFIMNMLDGMDVLVIAFTASSISAEWDIGPQALGWVFSAAVIGMTMGALFLAPQGDRIGRKKMILICASIMGVSILATSFASNVSWLVVYRFLSGLGIGGMLASVSTLTSEYAPNRSKDFWVTLVMGGYPIGAVFSGLVAAEIIPNFGWRAMFQFAGIATLVTIPLILFFMVESLDFLVKRRPANALQKVNRILARMRIEELNVLPLLERIGKPGSVTTLFRGELKKQTIMIWISFFMAFATLYFLLSWIPKLTTEAGLSERLGIYSGTVFNVGSFIGAFTAGSLAIRFGLKRMILIFMILATFFMSVFGFFSGSSGVLIMFGLVGFGMQGGFNALYPVAARLYPPEIRTTGVGWCIGAGRLGAVIGPIAAGYLIGAGVSIGMNFIIFAVPCLVSGIVVYLIKSDNLS